MSSQDKNLPYEILTLSHFGFKYCSVQCLKLKFFSFFKAEILDATKGDIINALVTKLTNLMNEQRLNELAKLPMGSVEAMEALEAEVIITVY